MAFMGFPWPKKMAGIGVLISVLPRPLMATIAGRTYIPFVSRSFSLVFISLMGLLLIPLQTYAGCIWTPGVAYDTAGAVCLYADAGEYALVQPHTSQVGWEPPNAPTLWRRVSSRPTATAPPPATAATPAAPSRI